MGPERGRGHLHTRVADHCPHYPTRASESRSLTVTHRYCGIRVKYEEVYLHAYDTVSTVHQGLERYLMFYNQTRPHQALDGQTPDQVYDDHLTTRRTAA
jgi:hypothetical protein